MIESVQSRSLKAKTWIIAILLALTFAALGAFLATVLVSAGPKRTLPITYVGIGTYVTSVLVNPVFGLLLWISTSPFARFLYLNIPFGSGIPDLSLDRLAAALSFVLLAAQLAIRKRNLSRLTVADLCIVLFVIGTGLSIPLAIASPRSTLQAYFDTQNVPFVVYFLAKNLITNRGAARATVATLLFMGAYLSFLVIHEQLTGNILFYPEGRTLVYTAHIRRMVGLLGNPAFFAIVLGMILPFNFRALVEAKRRRNQLVYLVLAGATLFALYLCYNRAGWLGALLALFFMASFYLRFRKLFLPFLLIVLVVILVMWGQISQSYVITERLTAQAPVEFRFNAIGVAIRMISANPLFGRGYGNFGYLYAKYASDWTQTRVLPAPHNTYINILVSSGLAGFIPYVAMFAAVFFQGLLLWRRGRYNRAIDRTLVICMMGAVIVYATEIFFSDIVASPWVTAVFFFIVGAMLGSQERASRWGDPKEWLP